MGFEGRTSTGLFSETQGQVSLALGNSRLNLQKVGSTLKLDAKDSADARPEVFSPGNALDAKIVELDIKFRKIKLSVKAAQIDEEKSLIAKFGEGATKSGATLKGIFEKAIGKKGKKDK